MTGGGPGRRQRLDRILVARGLAENGARARALILAGRVRSEGRLLDKAGTRVPADIALTVAEGRRFVGRGAHKLLGALQAFRIEPAGVATLDVGASTGGFTQVLLEAGAAHVVALDVGKGQLDWELRRDSRVTPLEGINARHLTADGLPYRPTLAVIDVSFISLELVLPAVARVLAEDGEIVALVKPQFEVGRGKVGRGGIVREAALHREVLERLAEWCAGRGWTVAGVCRSPLAGADGNQEFFLHILPGGGAAAPFTLDEVLGETSS